MKKIFKTVLFIFIILGTISIQGQKRQSLEKIRVEIEKLEKELDTKQNRERTLFEQVEDIDRQIGLQRKLLQGLEEQKFNKDKRIKKIGVSLNRTIRNYNELKELMARRIISMYKRGRMADWEVLFSMNSLNQIIVWIKYQKIILENDKRNLRLIVKKRKEVQTQKMDLEKTLRENTILIEERNKETEKLEEKKNSREELLNLVRKDKQLVLEKLQRTKKAYKKIINTIKMEEEKRKKSVKKREETKFASLKGKMNWPLKGKVVSKYGQQKHPILKTMTENLGIDIEGEERDIVRVVSSGVVKLISWQRGMGNLVLVDHGGGYYTVYGYLDMVLIDSNEYVDEGEIIGQIGDRKGLNGSTLHFQVWKGTTHYNPEIWLR